MMIAKPQFSAVMSIAAIMMLLIPTTAARTAKADEQSPATQVEKKDGKSSRRDTSALDDELLKDLGPDPLAEEMPGKRPSSKTAPKEKPHSGEPDALDQELLKGLGDGEGVGEQSGDDPLSRLSRQMRDVESQLARKQADTDTLDRQGKLLQEIEKLLHQAKQQKQSSGQSSASGPNGQGAQQATKRRESQQPERREGLSSDTADAPARQSTKGVREQQAEKPDMANMRDLLKGVWGQLPERQREQMLQSYEEQFLPKYEQMIADYFRSLAEGEPRKP